MSQKLIIIVDVDDERNVDCTIKFLPDLPTQDSALSEPQSIAIEVFEAISQILTAMGESVKNTAG